MIDEKFVKILEHYELTCFGMYRARGAYIVETDNGIKLLRAVRGSEARYAFEDKITSELAHISDIPVDTFIRNKTGNILTVSEDEKFALKDWYSGDECNLRLSTEIDKAISSLAKLHKALACIPRIDTADIKPRLQEPVLDNFKRRRRELKRVRSYLRDKKQRNEFENIYINICDTFLEQAVMAESRYENELEPLNGGVQLQLCHGSYTHHNLIKLPYDNQVQDMVEYAIIDFERAAYGTQLTDLYSFMRKVLEKNAWDMELGHRMLDIYDREKHITEYDIRLLRLLFLFPEKFWKITNCYYNNKKSWIPIKNLQKLQVVNAQIQGRMKFIHSI